MLFKRNDREIGFSKEGREDVRVGAKHGEMAHLEEGGGSLKVSYRQNELW